MRARLVVVFLVPLIAVLLALGGAAGWSAARSIQQTFYTQQLGDLGYFVTTARQSLLAGSTAVFDAEAARFQEVYGTQVAVFDLSGGVWAASDIASSRPLSETQGEQVVQALSGRRAETPTPAQPWVVADLSLVEPVFDDGDVIGAVMISATGEAARVAIARQVTIFAVIAVVSIALGIGLVFQLARWVLSPVRRLDEAMVAIEHGAMDARVDVDTGPPELRRATQVFNGMADEIERVVARQQEFAANASHELRNPLNALLLRVEYLATGLGPEWDGDVEETRQEGRRMTEILETLLALTRSGRGDSTFSAVDLTALAARRAGAWREVAAQRGVTLNADGGDAVLSVTDRMIVESALDALIDNAVKFSPDGGVVDLRAARDGVECSITVRDHGPGLTPDQAVQAADRFWRGADGDDVPGSGLGLAIATDLMRSIGGDLLVSPADGGGLRVALRLRDGRAE
ncbi:signal transduction histidine kinase [Microbacterium natoriense]|uniref:histidine kinase n=1 Tax=Microbacterium natoriense TaxID=284570 RepID=A0AAW8F0W7_9MICO|nr:HAMP domain-containing sensor histidine kinase [Microbacterium natoriense]MDQ0648897.1 signal transduction histidine kinase [Microbacterium natoriense]